MCPELCANLQDGAAHQAGSGGHFPFQYMKVKVYEVAQGPVPLSDPVTTACQSLCLWIFCKRNGGAIKLSPQLTVNDPT